MKHQKSSIWFTSDLHFWHKPILRPDFDNRPFKDLQDMEDGLIKNWNSVVKPGDTVILVGDIFFCGSQKAKTIMDRLNGKKVLVTGNHDGNRETMLNCGFDFVCEKLILKIAGEEVLISHYPYKYSKWYNFFSKYIFRRKMPRYMDRRPDNNGGWLIHGHIHGASQIKDKSIHVGTMAWNYFPVPLSKIEEIIRANKPD